MSTKKEMNIKISGSPNASDGFPGRRRDFLTRREQHFVKTESHTNVMAPKDARTARHNLVQAPEK
jgi:hypothetical protein